MHRDGSMHCLQTYYSHIAGAHRITRYQSQHLDTCEVAAARAVELEQLNSVMRAIALAILIHRLPHMRR
jgi:hypothetical protein